jgi:D-3-phosphoglycerate dehydrogenase
MLSARAARTALGGRFSRHLRTTAVVQADATDVGLLEKLLKAAKERDAADAAAAAAPAGDDDPTKKFQIQGFNAISNVGLDRFPKSQFLLTGSAGQVPAGVENEPHAVVLRSHKLQPDEVGASVRAIARCGAGTNNIPIDEMTARGIPVFNTPGANANSVKELVLAGLLMASRGVVEGIHHTQTKIVPESKGDHKAIAARIEKDKKHFVGCELVGKTLAIAGLGNIGSMVADAALSLGMNVVGYDPKISVDAAWRLPSAVQKAASLGDAFAAADYVSVNMPYIKGVTHHAIDAEVLGRMKHTCHMLNFSRAEIVDGAALRRVYDAGHQGKYICDFADEFMQDHSKFICIPHLGASTAEAEDNCAFMAADQIIKFLERGHVVNSVNFPTAVLDAAAADHTRLVIINKNVPGVLGMITTLLGDMGVNIAQQLNTSRDDIAYNVIDMQNFPKDEAADKLQLALGQLDSVISTRLIYTGSAAEGPASFYTKGGQVVFP